MKKSPLFLFFVVLFSLLIAGAFFWWGNSLLPVDAGRQEKIAFVVNKGEGLNKISENLKSKGLIKSSFHFRVYCVLLGAAKKIKAGNYSLSFSMGPGEICQNLVEGVEDEWVTIIEGLRSEQIGQVFAEKGFKIDFTQWKDQVKDQKLEGRLFPDSYLIPQGADQKKILQIIDQNFQKKVLKNKASEIQKSGMEINQILTLASIVERETRQASDRAIVAGILLKRLENSWPLQVDATVQYAVGTKGDWWPGNLTREDLKINSPFNTYLNRGLPPGAICNPGLSSIISVLQPKQTDYWFYISDNDGIMHYAKNSEEHNANVEKYLLTN